MNNEAIHNFIKGKLNDIANADTANNFVFGAEHLYSYDKGELKLKTPNAETLELDEKRIIPFTPLAFDGERIPLKTTKLFTHVIPIVFSLKYDHKDIWESYIEAFGDSLNGHVFDVNSIPTGFGVSNVSPTGVVVEHDASDWIHVTMTVFAYQGEVVLGNKVRITMDDEVNASQLVKGTEYRIKEISGSDFTQAGAPNNNVNTIFVSTADGIAGTGKVDVVYQPISYSTQMLNELSYDTPGALDYGVNRSNSKQHTRSVVLIIAEDLARKWVEEIEQDVLNTTYNFVSIWQFTPPSINPRTMMLNTGSAMIQSGTAVVFELIFVDAV